MRTLTRLLPGLVMIIVASAILLAMDGSRRRAPKAETIALFQITERPALDETIAGVQMGLEESGFQLGRDLRIQKFSAAGDLATANSIAKQILEGGFRMVVTASTPALQVMAAANGKGKMQHVFCTVTDPFGAGAGITRTGHPAHLAGIGTFQPVRETLRLAREMLPSLKSVGVVWNPAEACSEACLREARDECSKLGIRLVEATVDSPTGVGEAAAAVAAKDVQALWVGGDNTVEACISAVVKAARDAHIPVFTNGPSLAKDGAFVGLGADYLEVGRTAGKMAAEVLRGRDMSSIRIENVVPQQLAINLGALKGLEGGWTVPPAVLKRAAVVIDANGKKTTRAAAAAPTPAPAPTRKWRIHVIEYVDSLTMAETRRGVFDELPKLGLVEGRDYEIHRGCAQGDTATLSGLVDAARTAQADMIVPTATPALQAAIGKVKDVPIVFTSVGSGVAAGAGKSDTDHMPNVTGVTVASDFVGMMALLKECLPRVRRIGTLFVPSEVNSVLYRDLMAAAAKQAGLELVTVPVSGMSEVADGADALAGRVEAICQLSDNVALTSFSAISTAARKARIPLFGFATGTVTEGGAAVALARDYEDAGRSCARMMARVMRGESPAGMPFEPLKTSRIVVSRRNAAALGMRIPDPVIKRAGKVVD
ncbi:MAG: ABC transporter substrate-binding protein [Armatimonadetes bacterium]|nr:ABC transporter substrate-binding protein [Armatimonadota bacterium]